MNSLLKKFADAEYDEDAGGSVPAIDAHVHFWKYDKIRDAWITKEMKTLQQNYLPEDLTLTLKRNGITGVVAVQADQSEVETRFLVELSKTHPVIKGVVGWIDLRAENLASRLEEFSQFPIVKGWRHIVQGEADDFLLSKDFQRAVASLSTYNYTYDILIYARQLKAAAEFVQQLPGQKLIIDHCAKPDIKNKEISDWKKWIEQIAQQPNVYCKLSGLITEATWKQWSPADFYPYFDVVFKAFGTDRILFGSDWPVLLVSGIYVQWKSMIEKYMEGFTEEDREKVFGGNAKRFYNLI